MGTKGFCWWGLMVWRVLVISFLFILDFLVMRIGAVNWEVCWMSVSRVRMGAEIV